MSIDALAGLLSFTLIVTITPGPNNVMLLASAVNFGFVRTIPHMAGITIGLAALVLAVGAGLGALLTAVPSVHFVLKLLGGGYLLYLALRIATTRNMASGRSDERPMSLLEAAAFQWINPKAWIMAVTAAAVYADPGRPVLTVLIIVTVFVAVSVVSVSTWSGFGTVLKGLIADPVRLKWFNIAMGVLLAATIVPMLA